MQCPQTPEYWQRYLETGDPQAARHLEYCDACRQEVARAEQLPDVLLRLPLLDAPEKISADVQYLAQTITGQQLTCAETLGLLEAWREGELDAQQAFLVEEHLLWCEPCTVALEQADLLTAVLRELPALEAPASIAEQLAAARRPWWQRLLPDLRPAWQQLAPATGGLLAAAALLMAMISKAPHVPQVAQVNFDLVRVQMIQPIGPTPVAKRIKTPGQDEEKVASVPYFENITTVLGNVPSKRQPGTLAHGKPGPKTPEIRQNPKQPIPIAQIPEPIPGRVPDMGPDKPITPRRDVVASVGYSAQAAILNQVRNDEFASNEEDQANVPATVTKYASLPAARTEPRVTAPETVTQPAAADDDVRAMLRNELNAGRTNSAMKTSAISLKSSHEEKHSSGALWLMH